MNEKGFTLVELLAVVIILSLLALITSTAITKVVKDAKDDLSETQIQLIKSAADTWMADNLNKLPSSGSCGYLTLEDLKFYGLLDNKILDPKDNQEIPNDLKIKISSTTSESGKLVSAAEVNPESIDGCSQIYYPICTLASDSTVTGLNAGAKYNCKVDPNRDPYTFYVLTTLTDLNATSVNLIMDSNITINGNPIKEETPTDKGLVAWIGRTDYIASGGEAINYGDNGNNSKGPISAMNFLEEATKKWTNVNPQTISMYNDENGETYKLPKTYTINARLPYYSELESANAKTLYLIDYLHGKADANWGIVGRNSVTEVYGYWTLSSSSINTSKAWYINYNSILYEYDVSHNTGIGVRPVINVPVNTIEQ